MNFFLSKYYLLEKATLPELISAQTIEALAQRDIPGIFMAMKPSDATLTDEQVHAIKEFRTVFAEKYDYTNDWMVQWQQDFAKNHGSLKDILSGLAWATLVPTGVAVMAHGELLVWRVRAGEPPKVFKNYDAVEPTQTGDTWLITWEKEIAKPDDQIPAQVVALDYAEKLYEDKTDKERFDILSIDSQFDTDKQNAIPAQNPNLGRRVLAIAKRLEAAGHPFERFKPLLNVVAQHATVGKEATAMLAKYSIKVPKPVVKPVPEKPVVIPEKPVVPVIVPEKPVVKPETEVAEPENATGNTASFDYRPILWGIVISAAIIFAYQYNERNKVKDNEQRISPGWEKPTLKIDSLVKKNPALPKTDAVPLDAPKPAVRPDTPVALPKPKPKPKANFQKDYETATALLKTAESNIESCPDCIDAALQSLEKANLGGLDAASVFATSGRVREIKDKVSAKLKNEATALTEEGEKAGNDGKSVEASRILTRAKAKLELEIRVKSSEDAKARLKKVKERITHWDSVFGAGSNG
jgi:hypothetical protein